MAFNGDNMTPVGGNSRAGDNSQAKNAPMGWAYQSDADTITNILATGYLDTFNSILQAGQYIYADLTDGKIIATVASVDTFLKQVTLDRKAFIQDEGIPNPFVVKVYTLADFPTPVGNVISGLDNTAYILQRPVDIGNNQFKFGNTTRLDGISRGITTISGTTTLPLIISNGTNNVFSENLIYVQNGTGDLIELTVTDPLTPSLFNGCIFVGAPFRLIVGPIIIFTSCAFEFGSRLVQDGTAGGFRGIQLIGGSGLQDSGFAVVDGLILLESGSFTELLAIGDANILAANPGSIGIKLENGATILRLTITTVDFFVVAPGSVSIEVSNPDDILQGSYDGGSFLNLGAGTFAQVMPEGGTIVTVSFMQPAGIAQDGDGNILLVSPNTNLIYRMVGFSDVIDTSIATPGTNGRGLAWHKANLYSMDSNTDLIYKHDGFSTTILEFIPQPSGDGAVDLVFAGEDLVTIDGTTMIVSIHDGFSDNILDSFASPTSNANLTVAFDGLNLIIGDGPGNVFVMEGLSPKVQYSFSSGFGSVHGASVIFDSSLNSQGYAVGARNPASFCFFNHPITFDHSSKTWEFRNVIGLIASQDRGGSEYQGVPIEVSPFAQNVWEDIAGDGLAYNLFTENEKILLMDELTGELQFIGVTEDACDLIAQATITRGGTAADAFYQIAIELDGRIVKDTIVNAVLPTSATFTTISTIPISRRLNSGTTLKLKIRQLPIGPLAAPSAAFSKVAIT